MQTAITIPDFLTVTIGFAVFLAGARINAKVAALRRFNIPDPVSGGLLAALAVLAVYLVTGKAVEFEMESRNYFLVLTCLTILAQNVIGVVGAVVFGFPAQTGVMFGSASLIGGHGTAIAWAPDVAEATGFAGASELGVAVATLGLVLAALAGGPVANFLISKHKLSSSHPDEVSTIGLPDTNGAPATQIDHHSLMRVMLHLNLAIIIGYFSSQALEAAGLMLPLFVPCLIAAILLANLRSVIFPSAPPVSRTASLALVSEFALGAFLAMSLMSLQLWTIASLGPAIAAVLVLQTLFTVGFVVYVLFPLLGRGYRAGVLAAGFADFSLGATPTAIANMTAVTKRYGPSPLAFVVLPLVSAFFVDIANAIVIQMIVNF